MRRMEPAEGYANVLDAYEAVDRTPPGDRPWVLANMVAGIDGCAAHDGRVGSLSSSTDAALFHQLRSLADIVLVGAETVRRERYGPVGLSPAQVEARLRAGRSPGPSIAIVTRSMNLDFTLPVLTQQDGPEAIIITCEAADQRRLTESKTRAKVLIAGDDSVDLRQALGRLRSDGHRIVLCEGGPHLLGELVADDLLDELCLTISPMMGGDPLPISVAPAAAPVRRFGLDHIAEEDGHLFLRYERTTDEQ